MSENIQEVNLDRDQIEKEINKFMSFQQKHNREKKKLIKKEINKLSNYNFNFKGKLLTLNLPIIFKHITSESSKHNIYALEIKDGDSLIFQKQILVPKYLNINNEIDKLNKNIQSENYVIKVKNIVSKINDFNNVSTNEEYIQKNGKILNRLQVNNHLLTLENVYTDLKDKLESIIKSKEYLISYQKESTLR